MNEDLVSKSRAGRRALVLAQTHTSLAFWPSSDNPKSLLLRFVLKHLLYYTRFNLDVLAVPQSISLMFVPSF